MNGDGYDSDSGKATFTIPPPYGNSNYNLEFHMHWPGSNDDIKSRHFYASGVSHSDPSFSWLFRSNKRDANKSSSYVDRGDHAVYTLRSQLGDFNYQAGDRAQAGNCEASSGVLSRRNDVAGIFFFDKNSDNEGAGELIEDYQNSFMIRGADCHISTSGVDYPMEWKKIELMQSLDEVFPQRRHIWVPDWRSEHHAGQLIWLR